MIVTRHMPLETEFLRWLLLALAALALVLVVGTLAAADPTMEPQLLPENMGELAKPLVQADVPGTFFPENLPVREMPPAEAAARLWNILEQHRVGQLADALAGWERLQLEPNATHWRELAMGVAFLQAGQFEHALVHLDATGQLAPANAVVAYYRGLLHLELARAAGTVPDAVHDGGLRWVAYGPRNDRLNYERMAMTDLEVAVFGAPDVCLDERLLTGDDQLEEVIVVPRVGDLLKALGADNFAGKAHHVLFGLCLDRGDVDAAETHLTAAVATGLAPLDGYYDLAEECVRLERHADAVRLIGRDLHFNQPEVVAAWKVLQEAGRKVGEEIFW